MIYYLLKSNNFLKIVQLCDGITHYTSNCQIVRAKNKFYSRDYITDEKLNAFSKKRFYSLSLD